MVMHIPIFQAFAVGHHSDGLAGRAIVFGLVVCEREPVASDVGLHPEVGKEDEEEDAVHPDEVDPQGNLVVALLHEVILADVNGDENELDLWRREKKTSECQTGF